MNTLYTLSKHLLLMHEDRKHYICICTRQQVKTKPAQRSQLQYSRGVWNKFKDEAVTQSVDMQGSSKNDIEPLYSKLKSRGGL